MANISERNKRLTRLPAPLSPGKAGFVQAYAGSTAPSGWLECNGQAVSRTTYADLFANLGVMYGNGDGSTTFNLPDYRGQFLRGYDNGAGIDPDAGSRTDRGDGTTGDNVGTKQADIFGAHDHSGDNVNMGAGGGALSSLPFGSGTPVRQGGPGNDGGNETRPKNIAVMYIIKAYNDGTDGISVGIDEATATVAGTVLKNRWQIKPVSINQTSDGTVLTFNGLTVGKVYRISATLSCITSAAANSVRGLLKHDSNLLDGGRVQESSGTYLNTMRLSAIFEATTTTATLETSAASANSYIQADGVNERSFAMIEEINNYETETTNFT